MLNIFKSILLAVLILNFCKASKFSFDGWKLLRIIPKTADHIKLLNALEENSDVRNFPYVNFTIKLRC